MTNVDLERFRSKLREYRLLVNRNQSDLAAYLNLDYNELSNRLNAHKNVRLSHENVHGIVRALAEWGAITTREQAEELLDLMLCPHFDQVDLQAKPLSKLEFTPALTPYISPANLVHYPVPAPTTKIPQPSHSSWLNNGNPNPQQLHNLPQKLSSFIGRDKEVAGLKKLLIPDKVRLVTLIGPGGIGKTRLSLRIGAQILEHFANGVWLVELAPINNPTLLPQAIVQTLGIAEQPGRSVLDTLAQYLSNCQILIILDNCEHLIEECCRVVEKLLNHSTGLQILATSREALGITGELNYRVPSLFLPQPEEAILPEKVGQYEALQLFQERVKAITPDFKFESRVIPALIKICRRLDGIPLALELAAACTAVLTLEQIQNRLDDRFHLLTGGSRTALPRQQTLRAMVDWSYNLLSGPEKRLLNRASVFTGSWDLTAGEKVCSGAGLAQREVLPCLTGLVNKSLLVAERSDEQVRYYLLETIRQYGLENLKAAGEEEEFRQRHLIYYANLAEGLNLL